MSGKSHKDAKRQARALLINSKRGSVKSVRVHVKRAESLSRAIWQRFNVTPAKWQLKHLRWHLEHNTRDLAAATRYDHWRTVCALVDALSRDQWLPRLRGPWSQKRKAGEKKD